MSDLVTGGTPESTSLIDVIVLLGQCGSIRGHFQRQHGGYKSEQVHWLQSSVNIY